MLINDVTFIVNTEPDTPKKDRLIEIYKSMVYEDIDSLTYKYAEASDIPEPKRNNAYSSDVKEGLDGHILARHVEYRDAKLRKILQSALAEEETETADDSLDADTKFTYNLCVPETFKDSMLKPLATYIHRYLVWGALFDWYGAGMGASQARVYQAELEGLESEITNGLRSGGRAKRPMQPFGPARFRR